MKNDSFHINFRFVRMHLWLFLTILVPISTLASSNTEDSIRKLILSTGSSCSKSELLIKLSEQFSLSNNDSALFYSFQAITEAEKCGENNKIANAFLCQTKAFDMAGNYPQAVSSALKALKIFETLGDEKSVALILHRLGKITFHQSESCSSQLKNGYHLDALKYYRKALAIEKKLNNLLGITENSIEIGRTLFETGDSDSALLLLNNALITSEKHKEQKEFLHNIAKSSYNMSLIFIKSEDTKQALYYMTKAAEVDSILNNKEGVAVIRMAELYFKLGDLEHSELLARKSIDTAQKYGYDLRVLQASEVLYQVYSSKKDFENAFQFLLMHRNLSDSLSNEEHVKEITKMEMTHDFEKKEAQEKIKNEAEKKQQRLIIYGVLSVLLFLIIFLIYGIITFRQKQKAAKVIAEQKKEVEKQKITVEQTLKELETTHIILENTHQQLEESHKEITDSINYAERIQRSFLASKEILDENLKDYLVFFKPKDVVSGDFYWASSAKSSKTNDSSLEGDSFVLCCADSTGHGVPGAIMSLLNITSLEKAVETETEPHKILNKTREIIINRLKKDGSEHGGKDGMDCNLMVFNKDKSLLTFASANNTIVIIRNGETLEFKGDKMPVGKHDRDTEPFTLQSIQLQKGDVIYALTDGFQDQFGGQKGKKYMVKNLKELLLNLAQLPMNEQEGKLMEEFTTWKGEHEQIDDVCIIGVRI